MQYELQLALSHHRAGRMLEAEAIYQQLLRADPSNPEALYLSGIMAFQRNDLSLAAELMGQAARFLPANAEVAINRSEVLRRLDRREEARDVLRQAALLAEPENRQAASAIWYQLGILVRDSDVLSAVEAFKRAASLAPDSAETHNNLAVLQQQTGELAESVESFRRALQIRPQHVETALNLGLALGNAGRHDEAVEVFRQAVRMRSNFAPAYLALGSALRKLGKICEALEALQAGAAFDPHSAGIFRELGRALAEAGHVEEGAKMARNAVRLSPNDPDVLHDLGAVLSVLAARGSPVEIREEAINAYCRALELRPEMMHWKFELDALQGLTPSSAPDDFVRVLFDDYAARFEDHLVKELQYDVPRELLLLVRQLRPEPAPAWDIIDLGCGTGLCGEVFRPFGRFIIGIDLSSNMIQAARRRRDGKIYDQFFCCNLLEGLDQCTQPVDLVLAADVFVYVGDLAQVFAATAAKLHPGGLFAFSLESHAGEGYALKQSNRFGHSLRYVISLANQYGLEAAIHVEFMIRKDAKDGWLVVLRKPALPRK